MYTHRNFISAFLIIILVLGICLLMIAPAGAQSLDFDHDFETGFPLTGEHQKISSESCQWVFFLSSQERRFKQVS